MISIAKSTMYSFGAVVYLSAYSDSCEVQMQSPGSLQNTPSGYLLSLIEDF